MWTWRPRNVNPSCEALLWSSSGLRERIHTCLILFFCMPWGNLFHGNPTSESVLKLMRIQGTSVQIHRRRRRHHHLDPEVSSLPLRPLEPQQRCSRWSTAARPSRAVIGSLWSLSGPTALKEQGMNMNCIQQAPRRVSRLGMGLPQI